MRNRAFAAEAERWIDDLPSLVAGLERDWSITIGRLYGDATEAFVAGITRVGGAAPRSRSQ